TNTSGYTQWFFFMVKKGKKGQKINFNIMNLRRKRSKYMYGLKVWMYSTKRNALFKCGWEHTKEDVQYGASYFYRFIKTKKTNFGRLTFDYTFEYDDDIVYFANCIPYTYSNLMNELTNYQKLENTKYPYFTRKTLCTSHAGNDIDYITINNSISDYNENNISRFQYKKYPPTEKSFDRVDDKNKEGIVMFARQHPSETVGSWAVKGAIDFLMGDSNEAKYLRNNFIFKIVPMVRLFLLF
ncbi:MAG: M14-type cytosolic carboxypeptidase, partial [archaeon]|nr:M14-type cytosolic carboxypeptidase [archaeon]